MRVPFGCCAGLVALIACAPTPSATPLGWGPLSPGMQLEAPHHATASAKQDAHPARAESEPSTRTTAKAEADETPAPEAPKPPAPAADTPKAEAPTSKAKLTTAAFVGDYSGEDVAVYRLEGLPDRTEKDPKAKMTVTSSSDTALAFELVDSSNGNEICTLTATLGDAGVTIAKGQKCFEQSAEDASTSATVQSGTASLEKERLLFDLDMSFVMEVAGRKLDGSLSYHFDGTRK